MSGGKKSIVTEIYPGKNQSFKDSKKYPAKLFKELYFLRWGTEIFYDELKNKLKVEVCEIGDKR